MKNAFAALGLAVAVSLALPAAALEGGELHASANAARMLAPYAGLIEAKSGITMSVPAVGSGQLVLDVIDGKAAAAAIAMPFTQAVGAAREAARQEGRMLVVPDSLQFHELKGLSPPDGIPVGLVTLGPAPRGLVRLLAELR
jgi:hypothetical protein